DPFPHGMDPIPAARRIDIEPDEFEVGPGQPPWTGFVTMASLVQSLRGRLEDLGGMPLCLSWFPRFDPEIGRSYGQVDFVFDRYRALFDELLEARDVFGTHVHYYRWDLRREATYSDHADLEWVTHCIDVSANTFKRCFAERVRGASPGGFILNDAVVTPSVALGIGVDVTVDPGLAPRAETASLGAPATQPPPVFRAFPRPPFFPPPAALNVPANSLDG